MLGLKIGPSRAAVDYYADPESMDFSRDTPPQAPRRRASVTCKSNVDDDEDTFMLPETVCFFGTPPRPLKNVRFALDVDGDVECVLHTWEPVEVERSILWWTKEDEARTRAECRDLIRSLRKNRAYMHSVKTLLNINKRTIRSSAMVDCFEVLAEHSEARGLENQLAQRCRYLGEKHVRRTLFAARERGGEGKASKSSMKTSRKLVAFAMALAVFDSHEALTHKHYY